MYDNEKLDKAVDRWLKERCNQGYGQVYSRALLADFEAFLARTGALQASPGLTAFGHALTRRGFGRKRVNGLQWRTGLTLKEPPKGVKEHREPRSKKTLEKAADKRKAREKEAAKKAKEEIKKARDDAAVKKRMKQETKDRNVAVGEKNERH